MSSPTTPWHVERYSKCPRRCYYSWSVPPRLSPDAEIIRRVICRTYMYEAKKGKIASFRMVRHWHSLEFDRMVRDTPNYTESKDILSRLYSWYHTHYLKNPVSGMPNVPIHVSEGGQEFTDVIDVVEVGDQIKIHDFKELLPHDQANSALIYNDIKVHSRIWGLERASGLVPSEYIRWIIKPRSLEPLVITISEHTLEKSRKIVEHILRGIAQEVWYPSLSEQCLHCPYLTSCSL